MGGTGAAHAQGVFEEGLAAPRVFVIYCPPLRDPAPFLLHQITLPPPLLLLPPFFFNVLIIPTVGPARAKKVEN